MKMPDLLTLATLGDKKQKMDHFNLCRIYQGSQGKDSSDQGKWGCGVIMVLYQ